MTTAFNGKVALVTGASAVVVDRDEETIDKAAESLRAAGHSAIGVICDVTDKAQVEAMIERAVGTLGGSTQPSTMPA